jgi:hypothetical protein
MTKTGWSRQVYALRRGTDLLCGYLDRSENRYVLLPGGKGFGEAIAIHQDELEQINYVCGAAIPV